MNLRISSNVHCTVLLVVLSHGIPRGQADEEVASIGFSEVCKVTKWNLFSNCESRFVRTLFFSKDELPARAVSLDGFLLQRPFLTYCFSPTGSARLPRISPNLTIVNRALDRPDLRVQGVWVVKSDLGAGRIR